MNRITLPEIKALAIKYGYPLDMIQAVIGVESGGIGFSRITGKIIIQFEPSWFKRTFADWKNDCAGHTWFNNGIGNQEDEWKAFDDAFSIDANAAMESTSIGMMQVMGFHWQDLGFESVGAMWDFAKISEANQIEIALKFIQTIPALVKAIKEKDCISFAFYYNGSAYKKYNYDGRLLKELKIYQTA